MPRCVERVLELTVFIVLTTSPTQGELYESPNNSSPRKRRRSEGDDFPTREAENAALGNLPRLQAQASSSRAATRPETKRPMFSSDWTLPERPAKAGGSLKLQEQKRPSVPSVIKVNEKGKPLVPVQYGSRRREKF